MPLPSRLDRGLSRLEIEALEGRQLLSGANAGTVHEAAAGHQHPHPASHIVQHHPLAHPGGHNKGHRGLKGHKQSPPESADPAPVTDTPSGDPFAAPSYLDLVNQFNGFQPSAPSSPPPPQPTSDSTDLPPGVFGKLPTIPP